MPRRSFSRMQRDARIAFLRKEIPGLTEELKQLEKLNREADAEYKRIQEQLKAMEIKL